MITAKEIHEELLVEADNLLKLELPAISRSEPVLSDNFKALFELGFLENPAIKEYVSDLAAYEKEKSFHEVADAIRNKAGYYAVKYPRYKFVTDEVLTRVMNKYGLIEKTVNKFKGEIPAKNVEEIANCHRTLVIDSQDENPYASSSTWMIAATKDQFVGHNSGELSESDQNELLRAMQAGQASARPITITRNNVTQYVNLDYIPVNVSSIANTFVQGASEGIGSIRNVISTEGLNTRTGVDRVTGQVTTYASHEEWLLKDPIVTRRVNGGRLIISMWGDEASDPELNTQNN